MPTGKKSPFSGRTFNGDLAIFKNKLIIYQSPLLQRVAGFHAKTSGQTVIFLC
jgi:hypothetical protein